MRGLSDLVENLQRDQGQILVHLLGHGAEAKASTRIAIEASSLDSQSRGVAAYQHDSREDREEIRTIETLTKFRQSSHACEGACNCVCHRPYTLRSPAILECALGSLLIRTHGICGLNRPCDESLCRRKPSVNVDVCYRFPEWFLTRLVFHFVFSDCLEEPRYALVSPPVVQTESEVFFCARAGDIDGIARLFRAGRASACDIDGRTGLTTLHVGDSKIPTYERRT